MAHVWHKTLVCRSLASRAEDAKVAIPTPDSEPDRATRRSISGWIEFWLTTADRSALRTARLDALDSVVRVPASSVPSVVGGDSFSTFSRTSIRTEALSNRRSSTSACHETCGCDE